MVFIKYTLILSGVAVATIAAIRSLGFGLITRDDGGQASYMSAPKRLAALSLLDNAGIAHKDLEDDLVEVDCRFIVHTSNGYWREQFGVRHGYSVHELIMHIKRSGS